VLDFVAVGATHVALGTILFSDPLAPDRVRAELAAAQVSSSEAGGIARESDSSARLSADWTTEKDLQIG